MAGLIVYAFPGTGKSSLSNRSKKFIDLESSDYRWKDRNVGLTKEEIEDRKGYGEKNPNFLEEYKKSILKFYNKGKIVLIAYDLVEELISDGYKVIQILPNINDKELYRQRYIKRGNDIEWVNKIMKIFDYYIQKGYPKKDTYILKTGEFLKDIFENNPELKGEIA